VEISITGVKEPPAGMVSIEDLANYALLFVSHVILDDLSCKS
jgi:hypothetical protein